MSLFHRRRAPLTRRPATEDPALFVIAVEGGKTEPAYFALFASPRIKGPIVLPPIDNKSAPPQVRDRLIEHCRATDGLREGFDELWLVIDVDHYERHNHLETVAKGAQEHGYRLAVSRPCFEAWLLLHVSDDIDDLTSSKSAKKAMGAVRAGDQWTAHIDPKLLDGVADAVRRARARREGEPKPSEAWPSTPGSDVYRLIERLAEHGVVDLDPPASNAAQPDSTSQP